MKLTNCVLKLKREIKKKHQCKLQLITKFLKSVVQKTSLVIKENTQNECKRLNNYIDNETVHIYDKGDYSKIFYNGFASDQIIYYPIKCQMILMY